jgi:adenine-specific DNA-methyltransferase
VSEIVLPAGFPANFEQGVIEPNKNSNFWPKFDVPIHVRDRKTQHEVHLRSGWSSKNFLELFIAAQFNDIIDRKGQKTRFYLTETGAVYVEKDRSEDQSHVLTVLAGMGTVQEAAAQLETMGVSFSYPKPVRLISYLLTANCQDSNAVLMDTFAGSGTTGHAVLEMNANNGFAGRFILVEMDSEICKNVTAPRLTAAISRLLKNG